jgi:hypothetical protein
LNSLFYHFVLINLYELAVPAEDAGTANPLLSNFHAPLIQSRASFETIIRLYYLRHGFEHADTYIIHGLTVLGFMSLRESQSFQSSSDPLQTTRHEDIRSSLILASMGLNYQEKNYYLAFILFHLIRNEMSIRDVEISEKWMVVRKEPSGVSRMRARHVQSLYPVNTINITQHPEEHRVGEMVEKYEDLVLDAHSRGASSHDGESSYAGKGLQNNP